VVLLQDKWPQEACIVGSRAVIPEVPSAHIPFPCAPMLPHFWGKSPPPLNLEAAQDPSDKEPSPFAHGFCPGASSAAAIGTSQVL